MVLDVIPQIFPIETSSRMSNTLRKGQRQNETLRQFRLSSYIWADLHVGYDDKVSFVIVFDIFVVLNHLRSLSINSLDVFFTNASKNETVLCGIVKFFSIISFGT